MKPILFNTDMVRAILDGRKTMTRRKVKLPHCGYFEHTPPLGLISPYRPGDVLYVRETWAAWSRTEGIAPTIHYKADHENLPGVKWRPSIYMPRQAARIFLRVTDVRVERLQQITEESAKKEGCLGGFPFDNFSDEFCCLWERTIKPTDLALYGWDANPWVWVIEFERISKAEAQG